MNTGYAINKLLYYAEEKGLIEKTERRWALNTVLDVLKLPAAEASTEKDVSEEFTDKKCSEEYSLQEVLDVLLDDAFARGVLTDNTVTFRDLLDTEIMGRLTPRPAQVTDRFRELYDDSPEAATDWYYRFSQDTNYIRRSRMVRDIRWKAETEYGDLDITINLSKPEKDPKAIAAARELPASNYPRCLLCAENEGYAGRPDHPARQNLRLIPLTLDGEDWYLQYSPYTYYNEHCIVLSGEHAPMKIDEGCFRKLLGFIRQFPHYFVGSNADLPIVGGSILAHEHFQGGRYRFAMEKAEVETPVVFRGFDDVGAGIVKWPMSVIRIDSEDPDRLIQLAVKILDAWHGYSDGSVDIYAETDGEPHNTITPIARMRDRRYELDLVLRNNLTTEEHPLGLFHPHAELHHIKKENIGLIEVMGLAVLPGRLKEELSLVADGLVSGADLESDPRTAGHAAWADEIRRKYGKFSDKEKAWAVVQEETGLVFSKVLEHAGVFKRTPDGKAAFLRFIESV
ncbi:MAG: UDP-glucose--hexose-1-phosphate uridylyltransferase [Eubacterium sp.]|nr:UDP-glucose--hexose-1-phosphate uridylyltransferase [Eubacterium sp.]